MGLVEAAPVVAMVRVFKARAVSAAKLPRVVAAADVGAVVSEELLAGVDMRGEGRIVADITGGGVRQSFAGRVFDSFLPLASVDVRRAAELEGKPAALEQERADGLLTLGEIASLTGIEAGRRMRPRVQFVPGADEAAACGEDVSRFDLPAFDDARGFNVWLGEGGVSQLGEDARLSQALSDADQVVALCYGRAYLKTGRIGLQSGGMAARAARYLLAKRGGISGKKAKVERVSCRIDASGESVYLVKTAKKGSFGNGSLPTINEASLLEAASASAAAVWAAMRGFRFEYNEETGGGELLHVGDDDGGSMACCQGQTVWGFAGMAWRAASASLSQSGTNGLTGRKAGQVTFTLPLEPSRELESERGEDAGASVSLADVESLQSFFADGGASALAPKDDTSEAESTLPMGDKVSGMRAAAAWLKNVLGASDRRRSAGGAKIESARVWRQWKFLQCLAYGSSAANAARGALFSDEFSAFESLRTFGAWAKLRAAAVSRWTEQERAAASAVRVAGRVYFRTRCAHGYTRAQLSSREKAAGALRDALREFGACRLARLSMWAGFERGLRTGERAQRRANRRAAKLARN